MFRQTQTRAVCRMISAMLVLVPFASCDTISLVCGQFNEDKAFATGISPLFETLLDGNFRVYRRTTQFTNVCPDEHVMARFSVLRENTNSNLDRPVSVRGWIFYSATFPTEEVVLLNNATDFEIKMGTVEAGLKQRFGDEPAQFWVTLEIKFPSTGDETQDLDYVNNTLQLFWDITAFYFDYSSF